jgi:glucose-6-phosphate dehydrogenase assembly protein OpcA
VSSAVETFEKGGAIEVPVARIEQELANLWRQAAQRSKVNAITRACLWNLIVRVDTEPLFISAKKLIDDVSAQVPARVILMHTAANDPDAPIRAWVEANWRNLGDVQSGSDEVTLWAAGRRVMHLPSLVRSLLVTDALTALLWWGPPPAQMTRELLGEVDRLIVDTRKLPDERGMIDYYTIADGQPDLELVDCAWLGVRPLRGLTAGLFDRDPRKLEVLTRVRIISGVSGCQSRALLFFGWLAARLGWQAPRRIAASGNLRAWKAIRRDGDEVTLELETNLKGPDHGVAGVELEAGLAEDKERWVLTRDHGCIEVYGPDASRRVQPVRQHSDAELVVSALGARGRDPIFRASLREAARLVETT